ncbi:MAG: argininosuccinate lyase [Nitrospiraceae bacterium]|nr:MAG: argininosuccinate lyase [Nitrospiraceae bacterium]
MKKPWSGRFKEKTQKSVEMFTSSVSFDKRLWKYDIEGSIAHAQMLKKQKIISTRDATLILRGLNKIKKRIQKGDFTFNAGLEDVHMNIEHALIREIGTAGERLHAARSRNDQVALDLRLFLREEIQEVQGIIKKLQRSLVALAEKHIDVIMPGYTHLQRAQPVLLSHHLLAYFEMFQRDRERLHDCQKRVNVLPLGSCALAGTTLPIDRKFVAKLLKFPALSKNSIDAVSDRDFVIEFLSAAAVIMAHLSRFSEELVLWNSSEFSFIELPDAYATGSSIMPQKKNPDIFELLRGKTGRVYGNLLSLLVVMKGLPLAYNRDLQEDKEPLFDTVDTIKASLSLMIEVLPKIIFKAGAIRKSAEVGFSTATDLAEYLVKKGVALRKAHEVTGKIVQYCINKKKTLMDIDIKKLKQFSQLIDRDVFNFLTAEASINKKKSYGSTSKKEVRLRIKQIKSGQ